MPSFSYNTLFFTIFSISLATCSLLDSDEPIPSYIRVDGYTVQTNPALQGTDRQQVHDLWAVHDGNIVAAVPIPFTLPILQSNGHEVLLYPGIKDNATSTNRVIYPFFDPVSLHLDFEPGKVYGIPAGEVLFSYKDNVRFLWLEDFESDTYSLEAMDQSGANPKLIKDNDDVFEGNASLYAGLSPSRDYVALQSFNYYYGSQLQTGSPVYVELHYRNEATLMIGLILKSRDNIVQQTNPLLYLKPSGGVWKKVYVNLTDQVSTLDDEAGFKVYLAATLPADTLGANVFIDNIKLLTFE
ncbi:MAG: hypothetical protein HYZ16_11940 [Bacteroidetes bacterium]|nr:hypothetical protein [Bacteroidota bacterium]